MKNKKILIKFIMYIITIAYMILFVYQYLNNGFEIDKNNNMLKVILLFIAFISCSISSITNSKATYIFAFINYITVIILFVLSISLYIPKDNKVPKEDKVKEIICTGKSTISDNSTIEITYQGDKINKLIYTHIFDKDDESGAKNLINKFDVQYKEFDTIYSEITISDNVIVKFTYNIEHISHENLDENITSYKSLYNNELKNMTCKNRDN